MKFMSLEDEYGLPPASISLDRLEEERTLCLLVEHLHKTVEHIHFCVREAKQLGLQFSCSAEELKENPKFIARSALGTMEAQRFMVQDLLKKALRVYEIIRKFDGREVQLRREEEGFAGRPQDRRTLPEGAGA